MIYSIARNSLSAIYTTIKDVVDYSNTTIYDMFISHPLTSLTYQKLCERLTEQQQRILDVGVGTGVPLNQALNRFPLNCEITAIDINHNYLRKAHQLFRDKPQVKLYELDFYQMNSETFGTFDTIIFSSSFLLLNQPKEAIQLAISLLKPGGRIYFIVTLCDSHFGDTLKYITSIDLHLQSEKEFEQIIEQSMLKINYKQRLQKVTNIVTLLLKVFIYETKI